MPNTACARQWQKSRPAPCPPWEQGFLDRGIGPAYASERPDWHLGCAEIQPLGCQDGLYNPRRDPPTRGVAPRALPESDEHRSRRPPPEDTAPPVPPGVVPRCLSLTLWVINHLWDNLSAFYGATAWESAVTHVRAPVLAGPGVHHLAAAAAVPHGVGPGAAVQLQAQQPRVQQLRQPQVHPPARERPGRARFPGRAHLEGVPGAAAAARPGRGLQRHCPGDALPRPDAVRLRAGDAGHRRTTSPTASRTSAWRGASSPASAPCGASSRWSSSSSWCCWPCAGAPSSRCTRRVEAFGANGTQPPRCSQGPRGPEARSTGRSRSAWEPAGSFQCLAAVSRGAA